MKSLGPPELGPGVEPALEAKSELEATSALEPVRLLAGAGGAFERRLLASAAQDAMPAAALQKLAQALHVPRSALPTLGPELSRMAWLGKYVALAGLGALGVVASLVASGGALAPPHAAAVPVTAVVAPAPTPAPEAVPPAAVSLPELPPADARPGDVAPTEPAPPKMATRRPRASPHAPAQPPPQSLPAQGLRAELQALEAVQSALRAQHAQLAADALAAYSRRFPAGELEREAELLGVDVALARGERELARARARELLSKPDGARYRRRLDALGIESNGSAHGSPEVIR